MWRGLFAGRLQAGGVVEVVSVVERPELGWPWLAASVRGLWDRLRIQELQEEEENRLRRKLGQLVLQKL